MQGWVERSVFDLKHVLRTPLDSVGDCLAMGGTQDQCLEDQHVQGSLNHLGLEGRLASRHLLVSIIDQGVSHILYACCEKMSLLPMIIDRRPPKVV
ncbi:hypothetical protein SBA3_730007 [Candidatus Sulfopaludibacter sp. SbA3]|nr:hypothetical protein SBA3_730007 [Candidatus Sulfopaludibacter sp. SbA3]